MSGRSLRRLTDLAAGSGIDREAMRHMVAFNALVGGLPINALNDAMGAELRVAARDSSHLQAFSDLLQQELPPRVRADTAGTQRLATIQPDLVGEATTIEALTGSPGREAAASALVRRAYALGQSFAAEALMRLVQDFAYVAEDRSASPEEKKTGRRVMAWLLDLARSTDDPEN